MYMYRKCLASQAHAKNKMASLMPKIINLKKQTLQIKKKSLIYLKSSKGCIVEDANGPTSVQ